MATCPMIRTLSGNWLPPERIGYLLATVGGGIHAFFGHLPMRLHNSRNILRPGECLGGNTPSLPHGTFYGFPKACAGSDNHRLQRGGLSPDEAASLSGPAIG